MIYMDNILAFIANLFDSVRIEQVIQPFEDAVIILLSGTTYAG